MKRRSLSRFATLVPAAAIALCLAPRGAGASEPCHASDNLAGRLWDKYRELAVRYRCAQGEAAGGPLALVAARCEADPMIAAKIRAGMAHHYSRKSLFERLALKQPARLRFADQHGSLFGTLGRTWINPEPYDQDQVEVELTKLDGKGKVSVEVCAHTPDGRSRPVWSQELDPGKDSIGRTWRRSIEDVRGAILSVTIDGKSVTRTFEYDLRLVRPGQGRVLPPKKSGTSGPVRGFADLHNHQLAHLGFAGGWVYPGTDDPMAPCTGFNHGRIWLAGNGKQPFRTMHPDRTQPGQWTHHMDSAHQQAHMTQLDRARKNGLKLLVVSAVSNQWVADLLLNPEVRDPDLPHDDMDSVRLQLRAAHALARKYPWYRIARDPWEARRIIDGGGLAVVLAVEVSNLMPASQGAWRHQLEELYDLGVRSLEIAHEADSDFAGAAAQKGGMFWVAQFAKNAVQLKRLFTLKDGENRLGLTRAGRGLVRELARRHMLIEIDHVSRKGRREIFDIVSDRAPGGKERLSYYPLFFSHSRFEELMPTEAELKSWVGDLHTGYDEATGHSGWGGHGSGEYMASDDEALWVRATGGVFGLRTGPSASRTYRRSGVANRCHTSSRSLAQFYGYGLHRFGIAMALGTDINGFVPQLAPRFGGDACSRLGRQQADDQRKDRPLGTPFDTQGLSSIGLSPDLLRDLDHVGIQTGNLRRSAETFLRMWERTYDGDRGPLDAGGYRDLMGTVAPDDVRPADARATLPVDGGAGPGAPTCPTGYRYEVRNPPLHKDRCVRTEITHQPVQCKLLITDKAKNWTGPHARAGEDECRSLKGKKPKGIKCAGGFELEVTSGADRCTKSTEKTADPICPGKQKQKSESGMDRCEK